MTAVLITAGVVAVLALAIGAMWWIDRRRIDRRFSEQDRRIADLDSRTSDLGVVADVIDKAEEGPPRRRFSIFRNGAIAAAPVTLFAGLALAAASAIATRDPKGTPGPRITPDTLPERQVLPAEGDQPAMPDPASPVPLDRNEAAGSTEIERTTEAEVLPAPPPGGDPGEQGDGGGGLSAVPPGASPPSSQPTVDVELPGPLLSPEPPRIAGEEDPSERPPVEIELGLLGVEVRA